VRALSAPADGGSLTMTGVNSFPWLASVLQFEQFMFAAAGGLRKIWGQVTYRRIMLIHATASFLRLG
jgi:hypothetical protein